MQVFTISRSQALVIFFLGVAILFAVSINVMTINSGIQALLAIAIILGIVLSIIGLWLLSLSNRIHPSVKQFVRLKLRPLELKDLADSGQPISLQLGTREYQLSLTPTPLFDEFFELIKVTSEGKQRERITEVITYSGTVLGDESSNVRLTITEYSVDGYVQVGKDWWFIEPLRKFRLDADIDEFVGYRTADLTLRLDFGNDELPGQPTGTGGTEPPHRVNPTIGLNFAIDGEYLEQASWTPYSAYQHNLIVLNAVNGVYQRELGCEFVLKNLVVSPDTLTSKDAVMLISQLEDTVKSTSLGDMRLVSRRQATNSEVVHLTSAKNLDGQTLGIAWRPGVYSLSQHQLIWVGGGGGSPPNLGYMNMMIVAHELGHNFNGIHAEADEWCVTKFIICWDRVRSILWPTLYDDNEDVFSDGSRNSSHNNSQRISDNMASGRNQDFYP